MTITSLVMLATFSAFPPGGVIVPNGGFQPRKRLVMAAAVHDVTGPGDRFAQTVQATLNNSPPKSDKEKWWLIIYADFRNDPESKLLDNDMRTDPALKEIAAWCKTFVIDRNTSPAAEARIQAGLAVEHGGDLPIVLLLPNPRDPVFGAYPDENNWQYAFEKNGYAGDAGLLARNLLAGIKRHYDKRGVPCPGPICPVNPKPAPDGPNSPPPSEPWQPDDRDDSLPNRQPGPSIPLRIEPPFGLTWSQAFWLVVAAVIAWKLWRAGILAKFLARFVAWLDLPSNKDGEKK